MTKREHKHLIRKYIHVLYDYLDASHDVRNWEAYANYREEYAKLTRSCFGCACYLDGCIFDDAECGICSWTVYGCCVDCFDIGCMRCLTPHPKDRAFSQNTTCPLCQLEDAYEEPMDDFGCCAELHHSRKRVGRRSVINR